MPLLEIRNLRADFASHQGVTHAVDGVSLTVEAGEVLGIVGESGSGKSITMMALMGLVAYPGRVSADVLRFEGHDLQQLSGPQRRALLGKKMAMIFQDPTSSLNPCFTVGWQLTETLRLHLKLDKPAARKRAISLLEQVGIPAPQTRLSAYPHQLSGGMSQRVMIAMAIACNPRLLIADEPTTALDVTIQAQILDLLRSLQRERDMALVLITHNIGVVRDMAHRVAVMYAGQVMEECSASALSDSPGHPYTEALLGSMPERGDSGRRLATIPGMVPGPQDRPQGCLFAPRCAYAKALDCAVRPQLRPVAGGAVRCHFALSP